MKNRKRILSLLLAAVMVGSLLGSGVSAYAEESTEEQQIEETEGEGENTEGDEDETTSDYTTTDDGTTDDGTTDDGATDDATTDDGTTDDAVTDDGTTDGADESTMESEEAAAERETSEETEAVTQEETVKEDASNSTTDSDAGVASVSNGELETETVTEEASYGITTTGVSWSGSGTANESDSVITISGDGTLTISSDYSGSISVTSGTVTIVVDDGVTVTSSSAHTVSISSGANVTLQGGTYKCTANDSSNAGKAVVWNEGTCTIESGTYYNASSYTSGDKGDGCAYYTIVNNGTMTIEDGTFSGDADASNSSLVINNQDGDEDDPATLTITGGTFSNNVNYGIVNYSTAEVSDVVITGLRGVYNACDSSSGSTGKLTLSNCTITTTSYTIWNYNSSATATVTGCTLTSSEKYSVVNTASSLTLSDCTISGTLGVYTSGSGNETTLEDCIVSATSSSLFAIYNDGSTTTVDGGTYTSTGVAVYNYASGNGTITIYHGDFSDSSAANYVVSGSYTDSDGNTITTYTVTNSDGTVTVHALTSVDAVDATCTTDGNVEYYYCTYDECDGYFTASTDSDGNTTFTSVTSGNVVIAATGHSWGEPEWTWTETTTGYEATATFTCENDSSHTSTVDAEVTYVVGDDEAVYTATASDPDGNKYTNTKTIDISDDIQAVLNYNGYSDGADASVNKSALAKKLLTSTEKAAVDGGGKAIFCLQVISDDYYSGLVSDEDKELVDDLADDEDLKVGEYYDISLYLAVRNVAGTYITEGKQITNTKGTKYTITIPIPDDIYKSSRTYQIIRVHNGEAEIISSSYDSSEQTITFKTDKFSTYAIVYKTKSSSSSSSSSTTSTTSAQTGDTANVTLWYTVLGVAAVALIAAAAVVVFRRRAKRE